jgi:hypothetical protein
MKIYVIAVEALRKKERKGEIQFITKIDGIMSPTPLSPSNVNVLFFRFFKNLTLFMTKSVF